MPRSALVTLLSSDAAKAQKLFVEEALDCRSQGTDVDDVLRIGHHSAGTGVENVLVAISPGSLYVFVLFCFPTLV